MSAAGSERPVVVGMSGASGAIYGIRILEVLRELGVETHLVASRWAQATIRAETRYRPADVLALAAHAYAEDDLDALPASERFSSAGMVVAPCSMRTLAALSHGLCDNLVQRAAEVHLRQGRRLVLLVRESPLSVIHLENMLRVASAGAIVAPPAPAFYSRPASLAELVDHTVGRLLDLLGLHNELVRRWGEGRSPQLRQVEI